MGTLKQSAEAFSQTPKEKKQEVIRKITERLVKLQSQVLTFIFITTLGCTLQSCDKEFQDPVPIPEPPIEREYVNQSFSVTTIIDKNLSSKSFDPQTFVVKYSQTEAVMTLQSTTDPTLVYTKLVKAQDLKNGLVSLQIVPSEYRITFESPHGSQVAGTTLDFKIDETQTLNGTPITLQAVLTDFLVVYDIQGGNRNAPILNVKTTEGNSALMKENNYYYGYINQQTNLIISYSEVYYDGSHLQEAYTSTQVLPPMTTGKLYWILQPLNGTFVLNIPALEVIRVLV